MVEYHSLKYFIGTDTNIFYTDEDLLDLLIEEVASVLSVIRCSGKFRLINSKSESLNEEYYNSIINSDNTEKLKKEIISNMILESNLINKVVVLELFTDNEDIVVTALKNSKLTFQKLTDFEEFQFRLNLESGFNLAVEDIKVQLEDVVDKINGDPKLIKKVNKKLKGSTTPIIDYAFGNVTEQYTPSITEIKREGIRYNTHDSRFYIVSNLYHLRDVKYPLKFILDQQLNLEYCVSFEVKSKSDVVNSVKKTIEIEKQNLLLKKKLNSVDMQTVDKQISDLTTSGTYYNTTLDALYKVVIIVKSSNLEDNDKISSVFTGNNIELYNLDGIHEEAAEIFDLTNTINLRTLPSFFTSAKQLAELFLIPPNPIAEKRGVFLGYNNQQKQINVNFLEYFNGRTSFNFMIDGTMGQGKSHTVKKIISQIYCHPEFKYLYILDPDYEYIDLVTKMGGTVKKYDKSNATNFLHLIVYKGASESDEDDKTFTNDKEAVIFEKIQFLSGVFKILIGEENKENLILSLFKKIYSHYIITSGNDEYTLSFSESIKYAADNNIYNEFIKTDGNDERVLLLQTIIADLRTFFEGKGELLDTHSPDIDDDIICYDLKNVIGSNSVNDTVRKVIMLSTTSQIFYKMTEARETGKMGMFITEEFNKIVNKHETYLEEFYEVMSTRIRKFNFGMGIILHSLHDVKHLNNIFNNILIKIMMYTGDDYEDYKQAYKLSKKEFDVISKPKRGNAYVVAGNARSDTTINKFDFETELFGSAGGK
ncbi:MAG: helicase HerA domain-containing protein [Bacilli bacterium]